MYMYVYIYIYRYIYIYIYGTPPPPRPLKGPLNLNVLRSTQMTQATLLAEGWSRDRSASFNFNGDRFRSCARGWFHVCPADWLDEREFTVHASVDFPLLALSEDAPPALFHALDFSEESALCKILLADGPPQYFDKRILVARSEYFKTMLTGAQWKEGLRNEIDLTNDPQATTATIRAVLLFLLMNTFCAEGDVEFAFSVRRFADRCRLQGLVEQADAELETLLSESNVLMFMKQVHGSGSRLEKNCQQMVEAHECRVLKIHKEELTQIATQHPDLSCFLMNCLLQLGTPPQRKRKAGVFDYRFF